MKNNSKMIIPKFFDGVFIIGFVESIITFVTYIIIDINKVIKIKIMLNFLILIIGIIVLFTILIIKYIIKVKKQFNQLNNTIENKDKEIIDIDNNRNMLIRSNDEKDKEIKKLKQLLSEISLMYDELQKDINNGIISISDEEKTYLKNVAIMADIRKEHILRMRGEND